MKVLLIPDKFKGSLRAEEVILALSKGILRMAPKTEIFSVLASDGGDGFLDTVNNYKDLDKVEVETIDPLGRPIRAYYLYDKTTKTAYIELAKASGIALLSSSELNVMETSTKGTGIQIKDAIMKGAKQIVIGLGGSATNDGGMGIASVLGYRFLDSNGNELRAIGKNLVHISRIERVEGNFPCQGVSFIAVNDVSNPLFGAKGAAYVYAKQKGADSAEIKALDDGLQHLSSIVRNTFGTDDALLPGTGAAGGTAYGLKAFFNAEFISGINFLFQMAEVSNLLEETKIDYIITGEGKIDKQTLHGKLIKGVMEIGQEYQIPVVAVCGKLDIDPSLLKNKGLTEVLEIMDSNYSVQYSMDNAAKLLTEKIYDYFKGEMDS
ncbi:glycerate kinase [Arenibacter sp. 6A1]|uniref:glycerate kinase n=1 Tax=Arenibacter sp. 6A1 TaxID=2720391 RepID=UPI001444A4C5|nr:glycerate kinase [Arenibacter sp. 6A1]NKI25981.1 glycerate kinase [Arenibacter sp. 6A1]